MHRTPVKMRHYIPYCFVEKIKSSTVLIQIVGLIIKLLRSKDDALWKTGIGKSPIPGKR